MYRITVEVLDESDVDSQYPKWDELYQQIAPEIDIQRIIRAFNQVKEV